MKLSIWLKKEGMRAVEFARLVGADKSAVSRWLNDGRRPDWSSLDKISAVTRGEVTPNDFIPEPQSAREAAA